MILYSCVVDASPALYHQVMVWAWTAIELRGSRHLEVDERPAGREEVGAGAQHGELHALDVDLDQTQWPPRVEVGGEPVEWHARRGTLGRA